MSLPGPHESVVRTVLLDCVLCYAALALTMCLVFPRRWRIEGGPGAKKFGIADPKTSGLTGGVVPFTVAAAVAVFAPLAAKHAMLSR